MDRLTMTQGAPAAAPLLSFWNDGKTAALIDIAHKAGAAILKIRKSGALEINQKNDKSIVTNADYESERIITARLTALTPDIPIISEENPEKTNPLAHDFCWLVDPLDSTRDFAQGSDAFSINIGLLYRGHPVLGLISAPDRNDFFFGYADQAYRIKNGTRTILTTHEAMPDQKPPRIIVSARDARSLPLDVWKMAGDILSWEVCGSALKLCLLAANEADLFIRVGTTYEWDTAAGHAILLAQGGKILLPNRAPLRYGKPDLRNGAFFAFRHNPGMERLATFSKPLPTP